DRGALDDWRAVLAQLERDPNDQRRVALLDGYRTSWPDSPFALEAEAMSLLSAARVRPAAQAVGEVERWLTAHPSGPRALDLHASAAYLWRESLGDCGRAAPHDAAVAAGATGARQATAEALLGLCALSSGSESGRARLRTVDTDLLEPALRRAVEEALAP
ncbi:MAG: hypothetical protein KC621_18165, partial [Myxococcales bacterium]|nr:hypothetical protein [Myxococcales bacterium]